MTAVKAEVVALLREKLRDELGDLVDTDPKTWIDRGMKLLADKGEGWMDEVLDAGSDLIDAEVDAEYAKAASEGLDILRANKQKFLRLGDVGLAWVGAHFEDDQIEAKRLYIAQRATYQERRAFMQTTTDQLIDWTAEATASWDAVADVLGKIGNMALKLITKAALGTIGLA